jgi:hypothetical protein
MKDAFSDTTIKQLSEIYSATRSCALVMLLCRFTLRAIQGDYDSSSAVLRIGVEHRMDAMSSTADNDNDDDDEDSKKQEFAAAVLDRDLERDEQIRRDDHTSGRSATVQWSQRGYAYSFQAIQVN